MRSSVKTIAMSYIGTLAWAVLASMPMLAQEENGGASWPQFRGPNVDGISMEQHVFSNVGEVRLAVAWRNAVGEGMSSVAIANDFAVTMTIMGCTSSDQSGPVSVFRRRDFPPVHRPGRCV